MTALAWYPWDGTDEDDDLKEPCASCGRLCWQWNMIDTDDLDQTRVCPACWREWLAAHPEEMEGMG